MAHASPRPPRILLVEDDERIAAALAEGLAAEGYELLHAADGRKGLALARTGEPDLILLDLMLPGMDGLSVCRQVRKDSPVPILVLTARDGEADQVLGLDTGADDYLVKPVSLAVLKARVRALLRRREGPAEPADEVIASGPLAIDKARHTVTLGGAPVELTSTEFSLLAYLASHPGRPFTREQLLEAVWGYSFEGYRRTVDSHLTRIRKKLEGPPDASDLIETVYKVGYRFRVTP